jgi:hypothetical protein
VLGRSSSSPCVRCRSSTAADHDLAFRWFVPGDPV